MFNRLRSKFSLVRIREDNSSLEVEGIDTGALFKDIDRLWETSVVSKYMFKRATRHSFKIGKFFALDLLYVLQTLLKTPNTSSSKRHLRKVIELMLLNTWVGDVQRNRVPSITDLSKTKDIFPFAAKPYQDDYIEHYGLTVPNYRLKGYLLDAGAGTGKAQPLSARILTPEGWAYMGDMYPGCEILTPTGEVQEVLDVFPQEELKDVYTVILEDGRSTECCLEHLWEVSTEEGRIHIVDTNILKQEIEYGNFYIRTVSAPDEIGEITEVDSLEETLTLNWHSREAFANKHFPKVLGTTVVLDYSIDIPEDMEQCEIVDLFRSLGYKVELNLGGMCVTKVDRLQVMEIVLSIESDDTQCIRVSGEDCLYVTDDYIVTHNTATGIMLGKSFITQPSKTVIISPNNATDRVWRSTLEDLMIPDARVFVSNKKDSELTLDYDYFVIHYEYLQKFIAFFNNNKGNFRNTYVILDESHNFNDPSSQRTEALTELCRSPQVSNVNFASATPIMALGYECIPFLKCVDPYFDKDSEERFKKIYGRNAKRANDILRNRIGHMKFHVPKQDVVDVEVLEVDELVKLPNGLDYTLPVVRERMQQFIKERTKYYADNRSRYVADYNEAIATFKQTHEYIKNTADFVKYQEYIKTISNGFDAYTMAELSRFCNRFEQRIIKPALPDPMKKRFQSAKSVVKYVDLKIMGEALGGIIGKARSACNRDIVANLDLEALINKAEKKTLFFTDHVEVLEHTSKRLEEMGYKTALVYGTTNKDLAVTVKKFYNDPDLNPMIATLKSLSTAVPITCANHVVFLNQPFRDGIKEQARSRAARLGQDTRVIVTNVLLDTGDIPNLSTRANDIMKWSGEQVASIIGTKNIDVETMSFESSDIDEPVETLPPVEDMLPMDILPGMLFGYSLIDGRCSDDATYAKYMLLDKVLPKGFSCSYVVDTREVSIQKYTVDGTFVTADMDDVLSKLEDREVEQVSYTPDEATEVYFRSNLGDGTSEYRVIFCPTNLHLTSTRKLSSILSELNVL